MISKSKQEKVAKVWNNRQKSTRARFCNVKKLQKCETVVKNRPGHVFATWKSCKSVKLSSKIDPGTFLQREKIAKVWNCRQKSTRARFCNVKKLQKCETVVKNRPGHVFATCSGSFLSQIVWFWVFRPIFLTSNAVCTPARKENPASLACGKKMGAGTPKSYLGAGWGGRIHFIIFDTFIFFWTPGMKKNKIAVHGFWVRAGCGPIFFLLDPRGVEPIFFSTLFTLLGWSKFFSSARRFGLKK